MNTASHLSLAVVLLAAGTLCSGCNDTEANVWLDAHAPAVQEPAAVSAPAAQTHPCRTVAAMPTQKGCRPMAATVGSN